MKENTGNTAKDQASPAAAPTEESSTTSAPSAKKSTRRALTANERLEIAQQAIKDLETVGITARVAPLWNDIERSVIIVLPGVMLTNGILTVNGKEAK